MPVVKEKHNIKYYKLLPEGSLYQLIEGELVNDTGAESVSSDNFGDST
jgi:hypothetical protein